ncbi:MAG: 50S ribosomal protein L32 [Dehalococcoidia bacterium]|nr:50S ribosomal protein L32 [Dehalococcoidia bacterium]MDD5647355.1 50S ribosomal protein L32 [Dehalococcoidia bacterium]
MAPLPKKKYPKARQGKRRSHLAKTPAAFIECSRCHSPKLPHQVCPSCGTYDGREVIEIKSPKKKRK